MGPQIAAAQSRLTRTAAGSATLGGLPSATNAAVLAQTRLGTATKATANELATATTRSNSAARATSNLHKEIQNAESVTGRYTRGLFAASAASTGLFRAVSFASGAFLLGALAGGAAAAGIQKFADATRVAAQTVALLKSTGDTAHVTAAGVDELAAAEQRLTGISEDQIQAASNIILTFRAVRNETGAMNDIFNRAVKGVVDISSVFKTDLRGSAVQLGKALQDPIRGVTALRRSGITLSQSQRDLIKRLVETGRILTAQKLILGEVEKQVGGTARAIGQTLPGKLDILKARARDALGEYAKRVSESQQASVLAGEAAQGLSQTFSAMKSVVSALGPPLLATVEAFGKAAQAVGGVGTVLAAIAAYKGVSIAVSLATKAQASYAKAVLVATGAAARQTAVLRTQAAASLLSGSALTGSSTLRTASGLAAVGLGARAAAVGLGASRLALAAVGGPIGAVALGVAGLTIGLIKLRHAAENAPGTLNATKRALDDLSNSVERANKLQSQLAGRREDVSLANFNVQAATSDVTKARGAQARSIAAPGSLEAVHLTNAVTAAEDKLAQANKDLAKAQREADISAAQLAANERSRQFVIANTTKELQKQISAFREGTHVVSAFGIPIGFNPFRAAAGTTHGVDDLIARMRTLTATGGPLKSKVAGALETIAITLRRFPTRKEVSIIVSAVGRGMTTNQALQLLGIGPGGIGREAGTEGLRLQGLAAAPTASASQEQAFLAAKALLNTEKERLKTLRETAAKLNDALQTQKQAVAAGKDAVASAREGLAAAIAGLASARQALTDTIRSSREAVNQAVTDAKANLDSLGQAVADALTKFSDAGGKALGSGKLGKNFQALKDQILAGGGGPETQRAAAQLTTKLSSTSTVDTSKISQGFADLTDKLNRGKITLPQFNKELANLLKGFNLGAFRKQFGSAAANLLSEEIATLRKQARLILTGPQRTGGGIQQTLVRPLQAVAAGAKAIASAQNDVVKARAAVVKADDDLADAIHSLRLAEVKERRANTAAMNANSKEVAKLVDVLKAQQKLQGPKTKPKGDAGKTANDLTTSGAGAP